MKRFKPSRDTKILILIVAMFYLGTCLLVYVVQFDAEQEVKLQELERRIYRIEQKQ